MTDLEMTKACAEEMGFPDVHAYPADEKYPDFRVSYASADGRERFRYNPIHDDAQAMALVKRFKLEIFLSTKDEGWDVMSDKVIDGTEIVATNHDLNRAMVECVAAIHEVKARH